MARTVTVKNGAWSGFAGDGRGAGGHTRQRFVTAASRATETIAPMHKHLQNLQRLLQKMQSRYGEHDEVVVQLQQALAELELRFASEQATLKQGRRQVGASTAALALH